MHAHHPFNNKSNKKFERPNFIVKIKKSFLLFRCQGNRNFCCSWDWKIVGTETGKMNGIGKLICEIDEGI